MPLCGVCVHLLGSMRISERSAAEYRALRRFAVGPQLDLGWCALFLVDALARLRHRTDRTDGTHWVDRITLLGIATHLCMASVVGDDIADADCQSVAAIGVCGAG